MIKRNSLSKIVFAFLFILVIVVTACNKEKRRIKKLEGIWNYISMKPLNSDTTEQWIFNENKSLYVIKMDKNQNPFELDTGKFEVDVKWSKTFVTISDINPSLDVNAKWEVVKLNKDVLFIVTDELYGGLVFREFAKTE